MRMVFNASGEDKGSNSFRKKSFELRVRKVKKFVAACSENWIRTSKVAV